MKTYPKKAMTTRTPNPMRTANKVTEGEDAASRIYLLSLLLPLADKLRVAVTDIAHDIMENGYGIKAKKGVAVSKKTRKSGDLYYGDYWLRSASLEELETERDRVQADYLNPSLDTDYRSRMWHLLRRFDAAIHKKKCGDKEPGYSVHSEHGWYLPSDD